jgi:putative phosphoribosyl transferase
MRDPIFHDRQDAGLQLAAALERFRDRDPLILALPRGGVPVAFEIACALEAELDLILVRKLGAPGYPEVGIGAVVDGADPQLVLNEAIVRQIAPGADYVEAEYRRQLIEIERRRRAYVGARPPIPAAGRTVIMVDDGVATGGTVRAALQALRKAGPAKLVLAVPLAPPDVAQSLGEECDEIVCLAMPESFHAVGAHYGDFSQTSDEEVVTLLRRARVFADAHAPR